MFPRFSLDSPGIPWDSPGCWLALPAGHHRRCIVQSWCMSFDDDDGGMSKTPRWWFETTTTAGAEDQVGGPKNDDDGTANGPRGGRKKRRREDTSRSGRRGCHASHGTRWSLRCSFERQRPTSAGVRFGTLFLHQFGTVWVLDDENGTIRIRISC